MAQQENLIDLKAYKTKKKIPFNVGILIFGIIFFYLIVTIILYLTSPHVTSYEVREGSILNDYEYTGLAIREEMIVESGRRWLSIIIPQREVKYLQHLTYIH